MPLSIDMFFSSASHVPISAPSGPTNGAATDKPDENEGGGGMVPGRNIRGTFDLVLGGNKWQYKLVKIATYLIRAVTPRIVQHRVYCWVGCWVSKKMPKKGIELSAVQVKRLNKPGMHAVGGVAGLLLQVSKSGAR